jgi:uncharacterized protein (TIGR02757 family)
MKNLLDTLYEKYNTPAFVAADPVSIPHRYAARADREIAGFLAATIAWGNRKMILRNAARMMELMGNTPHDFVLHASDADLAQLDGFAHRTFNASDFRDFILALRRLEDNHGGLGTFFEAAWERTGDIRQVLASLRTEFGRVRGKHLSSVERGAACKRLNMFLRWMVRDDGRGVDLGLWKRIPPAALYLPLDVHSGRVARTLGLLTRRQDDWRAVEEITARLREFDPADPAKYDFALFGAGVDGLMIND